MDSPWDKLADDMKAEIICRIPERMMIRLKLVSKEWHFLISSICIPRISPPCPSSKFCGFIFPHIFTETSERVIRFAGDGNYKRLTLLYSDYMKKYFSILKFELKPEDIQDCCNGFVLVVRDGVYYVCNPTTYECIHIPFKPEQESQPAPECLASLAFNPTKSLDFKIISSDAGRVTNPQRFDIYSSETCEWSSQTVPVDDKLNGVEWGTRSVYFNGVIYRMLIMAKYLFCIDLETESGVFNVSAIKLPTDDNIEENGAIGISRGCFYYSNNDRSRLQIWMLKDGVVWIPKLSVAMDDINLLIKQGISGRFVKTFRGTDCFKVYAFHPNCDEIFLATPMLTVRYHFGINYGDMFHIMFGKTILLGQSCFLPYSRCSILLNRRPSGTKFSASYRGTSSVDASDGGITFTN